MGDCGEGWLWVIVGLSYTFSLIYLIALFCEDKMEGRRLMWAALSPHWEEWQDINETYLKSEKCGLPAVEDDWHLLLIWTLNQFLINQWEILLSFWFARTIWDYPVHHDKHVVLTSSFCRRRKQEPEGLLAQTSRGLPFSTLSRNSHWRMHQHGLSHPPLSLHTQFPPFS